MPGPSHPIWRILHNEGRSIAWLIHQTNFSPSYVYKVKHGSQPARPGFRARCAQAMGRPENELFLPEEAPDA